MPYGASAIATVDSVVLVKPQQRPSERAIEPNIRSTMSHMQSPSRFSAGITSGSRSHPSAARVRRIDQHRLIATTGWRSAAASISSLSMPLSTGETVHFGPP